MKRALLLIVPVIPSLSLAADFEFHPFGLEILSWDGARDSEVNPNHTIKSIFESETAAGASASIYDVDISFRAENISQFQGGGQSSQRLVLQELTRDFQIDSGLVLSVGKRNLSWDVSYTFLPFGFFSKTPDFTDLTDLNRRAEGLPLIALDWEDENYRLTAVYSDDFDTKPDGFNRGLQQWAIRAAVDIKDNSLAMVARQVSHSPPGVGLSYSGIFSDALNLYGEGMISPGDRRPVLNSILVNGSSAVVPDGYSTALQNDGRWRPRAVIGAQWSTVDHLTLNLEIIHDGDGLSNKQWRQYTDRLDFNQNRLLDQVGSPLSVLGKTNLLVDSQALLQAGTRRDYASMHVDWAPAERWSLGLVALAGLADGGVEGFASCDYTLTQGVTVGGLTGYIGGVRSSEFALSPIGEIAQAILRLSF